MRIPFFKGKAQHQVIDVDEQLFLRGYRLRDYKAWRKLREENRSFLQPFEPRWAQSELTLGGYLARMRSYDEQAREDSGYCWLIWARDLPEIEGTTAKPRGETLIGGISVTSIRRGASQSGIIGYWLGQSHTGRGFMRRSLVCVVRHCFDKLQIERLEASCLEENMPSRKVLATCGFVQEGLARGLLSIDGERRDHLIFARLASDGKLG